jgi:diguanylate cyclase (GGDEF)-like protein
MSIMAAGWLIDDYHDTKKKLATDSVARARAIVSALDIEIAGIQAALTTLATSPHIGAGRFAQFHRQATQVAHSLGINNVVLVDSAFRQLVNTKVPFGNPLPHVRNALVEPVFEKGHAVTTDLFVGPLLKQYVVVIAVPIIQNGHTDYGLVAVITPERLSRLLTEQKLDARVVGTVFDSTGVIVASTHSRASSIGIKGPPTLLAGMTQKSEGSLETTTLEGVPVLSSFSKSAVSNWTVALDVPSDQLASAVQRSFSYLFAALALLLATALLIAWRISNQIAHSISNLDRLASALDHGEVPTPPQSLRLREADHIADMLYGASEKLVTLEYRASHDRLTGLINRSYFEDLLQEQIARCRRAREGSLSILFIDLNKFKPVNDRFGHDIGDRVLQAVALRLRSSIRKSDNAARLGGDEFAVLLTDQAPEIVAEIAEKLYAILAEDYVIGEHRVCISASIGVAAWPDCGESVEQLLKRADEAMYTAKASAHAAIRSHSVQALMPKRGMRAGKAL